MSTFFGFFAICDRFQRTQLHLKNIFDLFLYFTSDFAVNLFFADFNFV